MIQVNSRDFRSQMSSYFYMVDSGEQLLISRKGRTYMLVTTRPDDFTITTELEARIAKARQEIAQGNADEIKTVEDLRDWYDKL